MTSITIGVGSAFFHRWPVIGSRGSFKPLGGLPDAACLAIFRDEGAVTIFDGVLVPTDASLGLAGEMEM